MSHETRAQALLNSPVGCALVLDVFENRHLPLEHFAEPKVSFWLAASAMDFMDPYSDADGGMNQRLALQDARAHEDLALRMVSHPAFAWWWEPVDLENQVWSSPRMPGGNLNADHNPSRDPLKLFDADSWRKPDGPSDERDLDPVPTSWQLTSTLRGGTTSKVTAFAITSADHISAFPPGRVEGRIPAGREGAGDQSPGGLARTLPGVPPHGSGWQVGTRLAAGGG